MSLSLKNQPLSYGTISFMFEIIIFEQKLQFQQRQQNKELIQIVLYSSQFKNDLLIEQIAEPRCLTKEIIPIIRQTMGGQSYQSITQQEQYMDLVQRLIKPIDSNLKEWQNQICLNCLQNFNQTIGICDCQSIFSKLLKNQVDKRFKMVVLPAAMRNFDTYLTFFQSNINCLHQ